MKTAVAILAVLFTAACSGPQVPQSFAPDSPASTDAPSAARPSVAVILAAPNPSDATMCVPDQTCALGEIKNGTAAEHAPGHTGHHHDHSGHNH